MANGEASTFSASFAHIVMPISGTQIAVPYVMVTAGLTNADGIDNAFDGRNSTTALDFESANKDHNANYDDTVLARSFDELASTLNCDTAQNSLNLLADAKATHEENIAQADNLRANAELAAFILGAQIVLGIANTALAAFTLATAVAVLSAASALLAAAIASCVILVGCALIPVYTSAVAAATAAVVASGVAVAANVAALISQAVAIGLIIDVAVRAGATISLPEGITDPDSGDVTTNAELAIQIRAQAEQLKRDAAAKVISSRGDIINGLNQATTIRNRFNLLIIQTQALADTNATVDDTTFSDQSNASNSQTLTNLNQSNSALNSLTSARIDADNAVTALGAPTFFPLISYPNANFPLVESNLQLAEPKMLSAENQFTNLSSSYLNIKAFATNAVNRIIAIRNALPPLPGNATAAQIAARMAYLNVLVDAQNKAQIIVDSMNTVISIFDLRIRLDIEIQQQQGIIQGAQARISDALGSISAAVQADQNATDFENAVANGLPLPTTTLLNQAAGVDDILREADFKGVQR